MIVTEEFVAEMKHAYQVLGVPLSATSVAIKQSYRRLVKRWHPDHYKSGTEEYAEATQMTKIINEAYSLVEGAPLRYHVDAYSRRYAEARKATRPASRAHRVPQAQREQQAQEYPKVESILKFTWLEFWIRFVFGALFGAMLGFGTAARHYDSPSMFVFVSVIVGAFILCAFAAACSAHNFWHTVFGRWWMWW